MGMFVWSMAPLLWRVELKCVTTMHMAQCVMTSGMNWRPEWSVGNWDLVERVRFVEYSTEYMSSTCQNALDCTQAVNPDKNICACN